MAELFSERFGFGMGMAIGVQATAEEVDNIFSLEVTGVLLLQNNLDQHRVMKVQLFVNGNFYEIEMNLHDEMFIDTTITGSQKHKADY